MEVEGKEGATFAATAEESLGGGSSSVWACAWRRRRGGPLPVPHTPRWRHCLLVHAVTPSPFTLSPPDEWRVVGQALLSAAGGPSEEAAAREEPGNRPRKYDLVRQLPATPPCSSRTSTRTPASPRRYTSMHYVTLYLR